ncbi:MAG: OB-fold nucleic acid binding domain-containing protein, partial [Alphaproteobacteria bacterium]
VAERGNGYRDAAALWRRSGLKPAVLEALARADAFGSMGLSRRRALWAVKGLGEAPLPLFAAAGEAERGEEPEVALPDMPIGEEVVEDYSWLRLSLKRHPLDLLRGEMDALGAIPSARLMETPADARVTVAGLVLVRQRPGSAKGVIFVTVEDETGVANIIVWPKAFEKFRRIVLTARLLRVTGRLQREGVVAHIVADKLEDLSGHLDALAEMDEFALTVSPADEVKRNVDLDTRAAALRRRRPPAARAKHPREQAKALFPSRDFH